MSEENLFRKHYTSLNRQEAKDLRKQLTSKYMEQSSFYTKLNNNKWTELEFEKLHELTGKDFRPRKAAVQSPK